jgi:TP901 family phage tail tape measure protein
MLSIAIQGVNNFSGTFRQARAEVSGLQGTLRALGAGIKAAGMSAIMIAAMMAQEFIKSSIVVATEFELSMVRIGAIANATGASFDMLTDKVKKLGKETMFTRQEVSEGAKQMAMAGLNAQEISAGLDSVVAISEVLGLEIGRVAEVATDLGLAFQLNIANATSFEMIIDQMTATVTNAALSFEQYAQSMTYVSATASSLGVRMAEVSAALGVMANAGIKGSKAGTALNRAIQTLIVPTGKALSVMKRLGLEFGMARLQSEGLTGVIKQLQESGATAGDVMEIFGIRASRAILAMVNQGVGELEKLDETIQNSTGITEEYQEAIHETAAFTYKQWAAAMESAKGEMGAWLNKGLVPVMKGLMRFGSWMARNAQTIKALIIVMTLLIINHKILAASQAKTILGAYAHIGVRIKEIFTLKAVTGAWYKLNLAMSLNPISGVIAIIGLLVALLAVLRARTKENTQESFNWRQATVELNTDLADQRNIIYGVGERTRETGEIYKMYSGVLSETIEVLEDSNIESSYAINLLKEQMTVAEGAAESQRDLASGLEAALIAGQDINKMTDQQIAFWSALTEVAEYNVIPSLTKIVNKYRELAVRLVDSYDEMNAWKSVLEAASRTIEVNNNEIDILEKSVEALEWAHDGLRESIAMATFEMERWNSAISVNKAHASLAKSTIKHLENQVGNATEEFYSMTETWETWTSGIVKAENHLTWLGSRIEQFTGITQEVNYEITKLNRANEAITASFDGERAKIEQVTKGITHLNDVMNRLSFAQTENSIKIRQINLEARKAGRDLTEEELAEIEELEIANEEKAIKGMLASQMAIKASNEVAEMEKSLAEQIAEATAENNKAKQEWMDYNKLLTESVEDMQMDILTTTKTYNQLRKDEDDALRLYLIANYGEVLTGIRTNQSAIEDLAEAEAEYRMNSDAANVIAITQQETLNGFLLAAEESIWSQVDGYKEANGILESQIPVWKKELEKVTSEFESMNQWIESINAGLDEMIDKGVKELTGTGEKPKKVPLSSINPNTAVIKNAVNFFEEETGVDIPWLQHGGVATGPTLAMVGERGPEEIRPLKKNQPLSGEIGDTGTGNGGIKIEQVNINMYISEIADLQDAAKRKKIAMELIKTIQEESGR